MEYTITTRLQSSPCDLTFQIPPGLNISDLNLRLSDDGFVLFDWGPIEQLCEASHIDPDLFKRIPLEHVGNLISHWYAVHLHNGGAQDPVLELAMSVGESPHWSSPAQIYVPGVA